MKIDLKSTTSKILIVVILGLVIRLFFTFFVAKAYFGRENIYFDFDFWAWAKSIENLFIHGSYTFDPANPYGYFGRMPGYSVFIGIFYLFTGDWMKTLPIIAIVQILLDTIAIYLIYKTGLVILKKTNYALFLSFIYATYPFIIVWNPVAYSESTSIFFLILFLYLFFKNTSGYVFLSGVALSIAIQCRPQIIILIPLCLLLFFMYKNNIQNIFKKIAWFSLAILLFYGSWPVRNYLINHKVLLTQDLRAFHTAGEDWLSFCQYIYSVKTDFEPQFSQIIKNQKVEMPAIAYSVPGDSAKLEKVISLSKNCGSSFSHWSGYWKETFDEPNCNSEIVKLYNELRESQVKNNPYHYYIKLPLQNLQKALFKFKLNNTTGIRKFASLLFIYRTFLILAGFFGLLLMFFKKENRHIAFVILGYFVLLYLFLCAGTGPQLRNIEMRYFLPADILMLIPSTYFFFSIKNYLKKILRFR